MPKLQFCAVSTVHVVNGKVYSVDGPPPSAAILAGRPIRSIKPGDRIAAVDVGGAAAFEQLADEDLIGLEGSADARIARQLFEGRFNG